jgi:hypothetical protein
MRVRTMTSEEFQKIYPLLAGWIDRTLRQHASEARPVSSAGFKRLPLYFSPSLLARAKYVPVDNCPTPPMASMGLEQFRDFEEMNPGGITYLNTYFVRHDHVSLERLHFHELIHVVQWQLLRQESFIKLYADGLERCGYRDSPLEVMAYDAEEAFASGGPTFDAEKHVREQLAKIVQ